MTYIHVQHNMMHTCAVMSHIIDKLSTVEFRLSHGVSEKVQVGALVGAFTVARSMMQ
jgi:hypothetical protein